MTQVTLVVDRQSRWLYEPSAIALGFALEDRLPTADEREVVLRRVIQMDADLESVMAVAARPVRVDTWAPLCMDADEFTGWQAHNEGAGDNRAARPCFDCPASFAMEMRAVGMCNGQPRATT